MNTIEHLLKTTGRDSISIYVPTPKASIQLQNYLFTLGYHWVNGKLPQYTNNNCIHICKGVFSLTYYNISSVPTNNTVIMYYRIIPNLKKLC